MVPIENDYVGLRPMAEQHVHVSWRAILGGILVALAVNVLLTLLGFAVGLTAFEPRESVVRGVGLGLGLWLLLGAIAAVFAGAYYGARVAGDPWKGDGVAHGVIVWAGFLLLSVWLVGAGMGKILGGVSGLSNGAMDTMTAPGGQEQAVATLMNLGYSRADAERLMGRTRQDELGAPGGQAAAEDALRRAADHAATGGAMASWIAFGTAFLSLGGGMLGGALGAIGERKQVGRYIRRVQRLEAERERVDPPAAPPHPAG